MGTKLRPGKFDCYEKAEPDEPLFVLLARDPLSPVLVRIYATLREQLNGDAMKIMEAQRCANDMDEWRESDDRYRSLLNNEIETMNKTSLPDVELVSEKVHEAWIDSKKAQGVHTRKAEDGEELMVPYGQLSEKAKELDRNTVRAVYNAIETIKGE